MDEEVIKYLNSHASGSGAAKRTSYRLYINNQPVVVEMFDRGSDEGRTRYHAEAYFEELSPERRHGGDDGFTIGNSEATVELALSGLHWWKLEAYATRDM